MTASLKSTLRAWVFNEGFRGILGRAFPLEKVSFTLCLLISAPRKIYKNKGKTKPGGQERGSGETE
jgi:hypothetical protein